MRKSPLAFIAFAALSCSPLGAQAMVVALDHVTRLNIPGGAASVVLGNPDIADVTVVDSHTLYVSGKTYGATDLVVLDRLGRTVYSGDISVAAAGASVSVFRGGVRTDAVCAPKCSDSSAPTAQQKMASAMSEMFSQAAAAKSSAATTSRTSASAPMPLSPVAAGLAGAP